jgi:hypothetical protein
MSSATPIIVTSSTRPGRKKRMYTPMNNAMGTVMASENEPHGDSASASTTTSASTASRMTMIDKTAMSAAAPPTGPISSLAIWPRDLPSLRMEKKSMVMSCTAPASMTPTMIQMVPGRNPICAASTGPTSGPAPAMAAK